MRSFTERENGKHIQ